VALAQVDYRGDLAIAEEVTMSTTIPLRRKEITLEHLRRLQDGPPLSPADVSRVLSGSLTADKIRDDIKAGHIYAVTLKREDQERHRFLIPFAEVKRYLDGFLRGAA
jgi:hypothetical protein